MKKAIYIFFTFLSVANLTAQENEPHDFTVKQNFFSDIRFGGGLGLAIGNGFSNITIAPSALKPITEQFSVGAGVQFNYISSRDIYSNTSYGVNLIGLINPIENLQLSVELEQLRVNFKQDAYQSSTGNYIPSSSRNFWNTGLFLGAGYRQGNATIGIRYNVLYNANDYVYNQAWMPFVRVYF